MITIKGEQIRWQHEDVRLMAKILGSEFAIIDHGSSYGWAPMMMSILKLARAKGIPMSSKALRVLREAEDHIAWARTMKKHDDGLLSKIEEPRAAEYFKHQRADLLYMYRQEQIKSWLNASEAGVGKTLIALRYAEHVGAQRNALIVPNKAKYQWASEIGRWSTSKLPITILDGTSAQQIAQINAVKRGWVVGHWESLVYARDGWLKSPWDIAILDELQFIQNRNAQRTLTVHKLHAEYRMAMGAHPYANGVDEFFATLKFLYPEVYTSFWRWAHIHIHIDEGAFGGLDLRTPRRPNLLNWEIAPFTIRRLWKDVWKNLPPVTRVRCSAFLTAKGMAEYKKLKKQFFVELQALGGGTKVLAIPSVLARLTRLRQYAVDPQIFGAKEQSVKYPIVYDLVKELEGRPPVIFTMWRDTALRLQEYLMKRKLKVAVIVGGVSSKAVNKIKWKFLGGEYDAVIIMIKVGGTALNFGKYGSIIYLDHPWNQRDIEQTEGRVRRPEEGTGKIVPATSYHIIVEGTYEEHMLVKRTDKHEDFAKVFSVAEAIELDIEDLETA